MRPYLEVRLMATVLDRFSPYHNSFLMQLRLLWDATVTPQIVLAVFLSIFKNHVVIWAGKHYLVEQACPLTNALPYEIEETNMLIELPKNTFFEGSLSYQSKRPTC